MLCHLLHDQILDVEGYTWFGSNRKNIHIRAKKGSGGVGFLIKNDVMKQFSIMVEDDTIEGILWLKLSSQLNDAKLHICICYLPPIESSRNIDANDFFDNLICQMHQYCKNEMFYICGDFNARCANFNDFIEGVDTIQDRHIVDFCSNKYGELLCEFLIDTSCCILNGRNMCSNDYTCIKSQGCSVVDYCLVPHEDLSKFTEFKVHKVSDLINEINIISSLEPETSKPDHSFLTWKTEFNTLYTSNNTINSPKQAEFTLFSRDIPVNFLIDRQEEISHLINKIETEMHNQSGADQCYNDFTNLIRQEMYQKVQYKNIKLKEGVNNKKRRVKKPWWSEELTILWNELCLKEKAMLKAEANSKRIKREDFLRQRKLFNKEVQRAKRRYWKAKQIEIENLETSDQKAFWKQLI